MIEYTYPTAIKPMAASAYDVAAFQAPDTPASGKEELSFLDTVIDAVNPLQHVPGISTLYRQVTGDSISGSCMAN